MIVHNVLGLNIMVKVFSIMVILVFLACMQLKYVIWWEGGAIFANVEM